jgi:hypothetical protein
MGQYIAIGITTHVIVSLSEGKSKAGAEELRGALKQFLPELSIFKSEPVPERPGSLGFALEAPVLEAGLLPLLREAYPLLISDATEYEPVLAKLRSVPPSEFGALLDGGQHSSWCFGRDRPLPDFTRLTKGMRPQVRLDFEMIRLFCEGKMIAECWQESFRFFQHCIHHRFAHHKLSQALRVYFSG